MPCGFRPAAGQSAVMGHNGQFSKVRKQGRMVVRHSGKADIAWSAKDRMSL